MSATANSGLRDAVLRSLGGGSGPVEDGLRDAVLASLGGSYVAGGPGGIPGAKDGLPAQPTQQAPWSMGAPVFDAPESKFDPQTTRAMLAFKQNVKAMGGDIDGKSDAEVFGLMQRFNQTGGNEITAKEQTTTPGDEFGRGLRRGVAYGLPAGLPGVVAMRENEQVQRPPEGFAGFAGQTLGGFAGLLDPGKAPANYGAIVFTGGVGRLLAAPLELVGKRVAQSLGAEAGARAINMIREAVENAGQGGGIAALNEIGQIPADDWTNKPGESVWRVVKAAGVGAAAGGTLGAGFGAARKAVPVPRATLPERVFSGMLDADAAQAAQEGRQAMQDVRGAYGAAPRAGEMDPAVIAASRRAELRAMEQARAAAAAIESTPEPGREPTPVMEIPNGKEGQGQGRQEGLLSQEQPAPEAKAPAVDSLSYTDLRKRAAALGVLKSGPQNKAALVERVTAAEAGSQAEVSPRVDTVSTSKAAQASEGPAPTREFPQTESSRQASDSSSPDSTRQPWEMTRAEYEATATDRSNREDYARAWTPIKTPRGQPNTIEFVPYQGGGGVDGVLRWNDETGVGRGILAIQGGKISDVAVDKPFRRKGIATKLYAEAAKRGATESKNTTTPAAMLVRHKQAIREALRAGLPVPPEVLADYPDLAASAKFPKKSETPKSPDMVDRYGIYEVNVKGRGTMYAVRESDRANGYGDTIHATKDEAAKYAQETKARNEANAASKARDDAAMAEKERLESEKRIANETTYGVGAFTKDMTPMERGRTEKALSKQVSIDGVVLPLKEHVASMVGENPHMEVRQEWKVPDVKRTTWNRMDQRQQDNWQKRRDSSGKYNVYRVNGYDFGKTGYDYAAFLIERNKVSDPAKPPTPAESGTTPAGTEATQAEPPKASAETTTPEAPPATVPPVEPTPTPEVAPKTPDITTPTPETRTDAAPTPKPPDDIPPRRVVNTPEPGELEGPITGIRHSMVDADRERLGINTWDGPEVRTRQASLDQAIARGINKRALDIAASVRAKPRLLNDIELAGMHHRMYEVSKEIDAKIAERDRLPDGPDKDSVTAELDRLGSEFEAIADVTQKYGGEDIARTLSYRNAIIKEDFSIARMKYRAEKAKGSKLTPEESAKIETMSKQLEEANTRIAKLEADVESARAESTVKRHASTKRAMPKEAREKIIVDLAAKARALIDTGCR